MPQAGAEDQAHSPAPAAPSMPSVPGSEYTSLSKADVDASLKALYNRLAEKFQAELHKTTHELSQEIAALGIRTDRLETKHDELVLAYSELSREHETLFTL